MISIPGVMAEASAPQPESDRFMCPHPACQAYAHQIGYSITFSPIAGGKGVQGQGWSARRCQRCLGWTVWASDEGDPKQVFPISVAGPPPNADMPGPILNVYEEARAIARRSPRSAAGLLRLGLQMLVNDLVPGAGDLNQKIAALMAKGLDAKVHQAMDIVRVVGNNAVHPGQIDIDDDPDLVPALFELTNVIVEQAIARPKMIESLFDALPESARQGIAQRNVKALNS